MEDMNNTRTTYRRPGPWQTRIADLIRYGLSDQDIAEVLDSESSPADPPWTRRQVRYWRHHPALHLPQRKRLRWRVNPLENRQVGRTLRVMRLGWGHLVRHGHSITPREAEILSALRDQHRTAAEIKTILRKPLRDCQGSLLARLCNRGWLTITGYRLVRGQRAPIYDLAPAVWIGITDGKVFSQG